jgi:DNA-binding MarR family transcriptional regulator
MPEAHNGDTTPMPKQNSTRRVSGPGEGLARPGRTRSAPLRPLNVGLLPNLLGYNVRRAQMALWRDFNRTVGTGLVRPGIFSLLVLVDENPGIAQVELATQLAIDKATVVGLLHGLERMEWISRRKSTEDLRKHGIFMTAQGKRELAALRREMLEHEQRFTRLFTRQELAQFFEFLRRIQI